MRTKIWGNPEKAKILVIGHDPRLQRSQTIACIVTSDVTIDKKSRQVRCPLAS